MVSKLSVGGFFRRNLDNTLISRARRQVLGLVVMTLLVAGAMPSVAVQAKTERPYVFTTIDVPGATQTFAMGNNARGDLVGYYKRGSALSPSHGFLWSNGTFTTIDFPGEDVAWTEANAIGPSGDIAGTYSLKSGLTANVHGFVRSAEGEWTNVDYPEGTHLMAGGAFGILPDGTIVGCVHDGRPISAMYGYTTGPNGSSFFAYPAGAPFAMHYGATPDGESIVGTYRAGGTSPGNWHGYLLENGTVTSFDFPGELGTQALGVNAGRDVVGVYKVQVGKEVSDPWLAHGYIAETHSSSNPADWKFTKIDVKGSSQTIVRGINSGGSLVGVYIDAAGTSHGFAASPGSPVR
jgi:hypothetical protein